MIRRICLLTGFVALAAGLLSGPATRAAESGGEKKKSSWAEKLTFGGDLRLRVEQFDWDGMFDDGNRSRFRFRFRAGFRAQIQKDLAVGFQIRSGNPDNPHSDNQSLDGGFSKKEIAISEAYVDWKANDRVSVIGGKFSPKKLWVVSDMQWDDDVIAEGSLQTFKLGGSDDGRLKKLDAVTYQFVLEESSSSGDAYMFGFQARPTFKLNDRNELTVGVGYDSFSRPDKVVDLTFDGKLATEPERIVTNLVDPLTGMLVSDFRVANLFAVWKNKSSKRWPVKVSVFFYKNTGAESATGTIFEADDVGGSVVLDPLIEDLVSDDNDSAFFAKVQVGDYKKPGDMAFIYRRYDSDPDAIFYAYVQSDTRRGTNLDGHRLDFRYGMPAKSYINVTWYQTDEKIGDDRTMDRWQLDYIFKF